MDTVIDALILVVLVLLVAVLAGLGLLVLRMADTLGGGIY